MYRRWLMNLLGNAMKHAGPTAKTLVRIEMLEDSGGIMISVEDDGPGVDPEIIRDIVRPYSRTDASADTDGVGLGLWIVTQIAEAHGCELNVTSAPGKGFRVEMTVPEARVAVMTERPMAVCVGL